MSVKSKIKNVINSFRENPSFARKVFIVCLLIIIVMSCVLLYIIYSSSTMENEIFRNMKVTVAQAKNNIDYRMGQVEDNAMSFLATVYPYLNSSAASYNEQIQEFSEMKRIISEYEGHHMITKLRLYVPGSKLYSKQRDTFYSLDSLQSDSGEMVASLRNGHFWLETHNISRSFGEKSIPVVSDVSSVSSINNYNQTVGVLFLDVDVSQFNYMLSSGLEDNKSLFLVNAEGRVLAHSNASLIGSDAFSGVPDFEFNEASGSATLKIDKEETLLAYSNLESADWYVVMTIPRASAFSFSYFLLDIIRLILILIIVPSFVTAILVTYKLVLERTISRVINVIRTIEKKGISPIAEQHNSVKAANKKAHPYSLNSLENQANHLAVTINSLLDRQYKNEISVRDYQMQALQAQINPHFLYNTLDIIKWMIVDGKTDDSVFMVNSLSKYFQLSLSKGKDVVSIKNEIELTKTYISIMQKRFDNKFSAEFSVDPEVTDCLIPKLSLQPIVENALLHGVLYAEKPDLVLSIRVIREDEFVRIEIEDNGEGIDADTLLSLQENSIPSKTYGLSNVRERLELFGMDKKGFEIFSKKRVGTCVSIRLPVRFEAK